MKRCNVVDSTPTWHAGELGSIPGRVPCTSYCMCKNMALNIRHCVYLCLSDDILKSVSSLCMVSMPGEVKYPTS